MFTGLIEDIGKVLAIKRVEQGLQVSMQTALDLKAIKIGDSISCNGACLTVIKKDAKSFVVDLSHETVTRTTWKDIKVGEQINLEQALRLGDRLGGHIVSGHLDGIGKISRITKRGQATDITLLCDNSLLKYIVEKGSITIDGISLTVNIVDNQGFGVTLIPHTKTLTTLLSKRVGASINLECDIIGKYVEKLVLKDGKINRSYLAEHGFLK